MLGVLVGLLYAAILTSTTPLFTFPMSIALLKEKVTAIVLVSTALIVAGVILVS